MEIIEIDLSKTEHCDHLLFLLNLYMLDPMGGEKAMEEKHRTPLISGLKQQNNYVGFIIYKQKEPVALANCFIGFSTFKAKQLINIHDFIVHPDYRNQKLGETLLNSIAAYAQKNNMCRVSLEVREDNPKAMNLYKKVGFSPCQPNMYFWEKHV